MREVKSGEESQDTDGDGDGDGDGDVDRIEQKENHGDEEDADFGGNSEKDDESSDDKKQESGSEVIFENYGCEIDSDGKEICNFGSDSSRDEGERDGEGSAKESQLAEPDAELGDGTSGNDQVGSRTIVADTLAHKKRDIGMDEYSNYHHYDKKLDRVELNRVRRQTINDYYDLTRSFENFRIEYEAILGSYNDNMREYAGKKPADPVEKTAAEVELVKRAETKFMEAIMNMQE
ncbi:hypothetical protein AYI70_g6797 [Smittium culicis]|uniref:Uncharacterized protein n=1 Tax=Smittium culicis TaxID=133412 RepID=A0A1R1XNB7_9FUNG|nr:hypothetical protein AYI70_g6797 [Smittium culicis]